MLSDIVQSRILSLLFFLLILSACSLEVDLPMCDAKVVNDQIISSIDPRFKEPTKANGKNYMSIADAVTTEVTNEYRRCSAKIHPNFSANDFFGVLKMEKLNNPEFNTAGKGSPVEYIISKSSKGYTVALQNKSGSLQTIVDYAQDYYEMEHNIGDPKIEPANRISKTTWDILLFALTQNAVMNAKMGKIPAQKMDTTPKNELTIDEVIAMPTTPLSDASTATISSQQFAPPPSENAAKATSKSASAVTHTSDNIDELANQVNECLKNHNCTRDQLEKFCGGDTTQSQRPDITKIYESVCQ